MKQHLLDKWRQLVRERDVASDPRWKALATGTASAEQEAELRAWAERSPAAKAAYEAFRPMDPSTLDTLAQDVLARMAEEKRDPQRHSAANQSGADPLVKQPPAPVLTTAPPSKSKFPVVVLLVILVVAMLLCVIWMITNPLSCRLPRLFMMRSLALPQ